MATLAALKTEAQKLRTEILAFEGKGNLTVEPPPGQLRGPRGARARADCEG